MEEKKTPVYNSKAIEEKWQKRWADDKLYESDIDETKPKHYALTMLPYPSGNLHIGHWYSITPSDAHARYMLQRHVPDGVRRFRSACGKCRHQAQHPSRSLDLLQHRPHARSAQIHGLHV